MNNSALPKSGFWSALKEKHKLLIEEDQEVTGAFEFLLGMFEYENLPMSVDIDHLELFILTNGLASIRKDKDGDYVAMMADCADAPDVYGEGKKIISRTLNGQVYIDERDSEDVAYCWNNHTHTPCADAYRLGSYIAEIDTSLDLLVWWSRASKLFIASDNKQKQMLQDAFGAVKKGTPLSVVSENILREIETGKLGLDAVDITDMSYADKLDKLAYIREKRFDWFKDRYGMCARDTAKKAQVSIDEANGGTGSSMIFPLNMLAERQRFIEMCNRKFGWSAEVHFAGAWLGEMERYETTIVQNGDIDIDGYDAIEEGDEAGNEAVNEAENEAAAEPDNEPGRSDEGSRESEDRGSDQESEETRKKVSGGD